jgi:hypothetical protein
MQKSQALSLAFFVFWWPVAESNHGHADFQSAALPTELTGRLNKAVIGGQSRNRTTDTRIFNPLLYQLS